MRTSRIELGTAVIPLGLENPFRLAEDLATVDVLSRVAETPPRNGKVTAVHAELVPDTKSGTPGADSVKAKAAITWVGNADGVSAEVRLYDRLFTVPNPDTDEDGKTYRDYLNPESRKVVTGYVEPAAADAAPEQSFQFERTGYFVADRRDHTAATPVFNRSVTLRDTWAGK